MSTTRRERLLGVATGFALAALVASAALAVWGLKWASEPIVPPGADRLALDGADKSHLDPVLLTTAAVSVVVLGAVFSGMRRSRARHSVVDEDEPPEVARALDGPSQGATLWPIVGVTALVAAAWLNHLPSRFQFVRDHFMPTAQAPAAAGAWILAFAGTVAAAGALANSLRPLERPGFTGATCGLVAALVAVAGVVYVSSGGHNLDSTTATDAPIPAVPVRLGERQFSFTVHQSPARSQSDPSELVAAGGSGFLVLEETGVRAYDSGGHERWHYLRTGRPNLAATEMQVYDDGHSVLVHLAGGDPRASGLVSRVVALDAVTGRTLWEADDFGRHYSMRAPYWMAEGSRYMLADEGEGRYTRIDTRTGKPMWSLELNDPNCVVRGADDPDRVSYVSACISGEDVTLRVVSLNAVNGQAVLDKVIDRYHLARLDRHPQSPTANLNLSVRPATQTAIAVSDYTAGATNPHGWRAIDVTTGDSVWIKEPVPFRGNPGRDVLTEAQGASGPVLAMRRIPDLIDRCMLSEPPRRNRAVAWLGEQLVTLRSGPGIASFSRETCALVQRRLPSAAFYDALIPSPGALLAISKSGNTLVVDGYSGPPPQL